MSKPTSLRVLLRHTLALFGKRVFVAFTALKQQVGMSAAKAAILVLIFTPVITTLYSITRAGTSANNTVHAVSPATLNFQARLLTSSGNLVPDGVYNVEFKIYNVDTAGTALWTETRLTSDPSAQQIVVKNGYLSAYLGDKTALPTNIWNQQLWLTMNIGGTGGSPSWDGEMTPRIRLTSVPFAFRATAADSAETLSKNTGSFTGTVDFATLTADRKYIFPDTSLATTASPGTICVFNGAASNCPAASGSAYYLQNDTVLQTQTNFHIQARDSGVNGTIGGVITGAANGQTVDLLQFRASDDSTVLAAVTAAGNLQVAGSVDTRTATTLSLGNSTATAVSISKSGVTTTVNGALTVSEASTFNGNVSLAAGKTLTVTAGTTYLNSDPSGTATPTFVASNTVQGTTTSVSFTKPGTAMSGDLAIVFLATNSGRTVTPPAGWTTVAKDTSTGGLFNLDGTMFYKILTGSEPSSWSFGVNSLSNTAGTLVIYRNATIGTTAVSHSTSSGASFSTPTISTTAGATVLSSWLMMSATNVTGFGAATAVPDASITNRTGVITGSDAFARSAAGEQVTSSAGTTTARTVTASNSSNFDAVARTIEILGSSGGTDALVVSNSTSAANIAVFKDNTRNVVTIANDGVVTFQNSADSTNAFTIQNAAGTAQFTVDTTNSLVTATNLQSGSLTVTNAGNVAFQRNTTDYTAVGTQDNINFGTGALFRITSASALTINGIAGGADGRIITLVNASSNAVTIGNNASGTAANKIITGTGSSLTVPVGSSVQLVYDSSSNVWRVVGGTAISGGYANQQLSNLSGTVAVNASLNPGTDNTLDLGSSANSWANLYADTKVYTPSVDIASAGTLNLGTTTANAVSISKSGVTTTVNGALTVSEAATLSSTLNVTGASTLSGGATIRGLTVDSATANTDKILITVGAAGAGNVFNGTITNADLTAARTWTLPDASGTFITTGNLTAINQVGTITAGTWNGTSVADAYIDDSITISSAGSVDWTALTGYPAACSAGQAITQLGDSVTCSAFATGSAADYIQNQNASQQATSNYWISGSGRADTSFLTPSLDVATAGTLSIGTTTASAISISKSGVTTTVNGALTVSQATVLSSTVSINGTTTFSGVATDITTGTNEDLTLDANGTGKTIINDSLNIGASAGSGTTFTNNGATVATTLALTDFATGGSIGTAASTVDKYTAISVAQTTASQTLTVPSPTASTTYGRIVYLANIGTASFTLLGSTLNPGTTATLMWAHTNGADSWVFAGADGNGILNQNSTDQSANFRISGTGRANTALQAPLFDTATAVALGIGTSNATNITIGHNAGTFAVDGTNFDLTTAGVLTLAGGQTNDITTQTNANLTLQANGTGTIVLNDTVTTAGTMTFSGVATDITTGTNEDLTVVANGTGTIVLNDTVTVASTMTFSGVATDITTGTNEDLTIDANGTGKTIVNDNFTIGASAGSGTTFTNNGSTVATTLALTDFATGGAIGTAANTVDKYTAISVAQTTGSQTLTIPTPTANTTYGRIVYIANIGTTAFNLLNSTLNPGATATLMWVHANGADAWVFAGADGTSINNQIAAAQNGDFWIQAGGSSTGIGRVDGKLLTPTVDTATAVTLNLGTTTATAISLGKVGVTTTNIGNLTVGSAAGSGTLFVNNGATLNTVKAVANDSDGGSLGGTPGTPLTAAQSVDIYTSFTVNQTTTGQTITLPSPTSATAGRLIYIANIGSASFGLLGSTLNAGSTATLMWNGTAWTFAGADGTSINNQKTAGQNGDFWIQAGGSSTGIGRADGGLQAPSLDTATAAALAIGTTNATNITIGHNAGTVAVDGTNFDLSTAGVITLAGGQTSDITTANASTAAGITIKPGNSTGNNVAGANLTLQGGAATLGNANGGGVVIAGGAGVGTGTQGLVSLSTSAFTSLALPSFGADTNVNALSANAVNLYSSLTATATASGKTLTINAPTITTVGRLLYVANVGSNDFNILLAGTSVSISLKPNTTATLIWNGTGWTAAGASSSTDLQAAYNNTLTSAGGAELVLNAPGGAADGLTIRNNATTPIVGGILEVQTSVGSNIMSVNNNATEYAANGGAETAGGTTTTFPASTWTQSPTGGTQATVSRTITSGEFATGIAAAKVVTTGATTANQGVADQIAVNGTNTALTANLTYTVSFTVKANSNFNTLDVVYSKDGTNTGTTACKTGATATESIWSRISCTFTAPSSGITSSNAVFIRQSNSNSAARTFYIDNLSVNVNANTNLAADGSADVAANIGAGTLNWGSVNTATVAQSTSTLYDTAGAVSVTTSGTATRGVYNKLSNNIVPANSTQYRVSFYAKGNNTANLSVAYTPDNGTTNIACQDYNAQAINASSWTLISCYFTTTTASVTNAQIRITQSSGAATIFYVDALNVNFNNNNANNVQVGGANLGGPTTLLTLDRSSTAPIAANNDAYLGSMYYDTTTGRIQCYEADGWGACGSSPDNIITLTPEYPGAVLGGAGQVGTGSMQTAGIGVMTSEFCSKETGILEAFAGASNLCATHEARNFYHWTSPQATQQVYSIYVVYKLPTTFKGFNDSNTIKLTAYTDSLTNGIATLHVFRKNAAGTAISSCGNNSNPNLDQTINTATGTWQQTPYDLADETTCGFSGGDNIIFKIDMKSQSNGNVYVENLDFVYTNN